MAESQPVASEATKDDPAAEDTSQPPHETEETETSGKKKKKSKKSKAGQDGPSSEESAASKTPSKLSTSQAKALLEANPSLKSDLGNVTPDQAAELVKKMDLATLLTGASIGGKNAKDMASYKFWQTQPVPRFDDKPKSEEGPIKTITPEMVPAEPDPLIEGFEWVTLDLENREEVKELYELLTFHYVEDDHAMFRFNYSESFLNWALKSPGWKNLWHIGVRASKSRKLVASICGVPTELRVRQNVLKVTEINFLCIHKKLRSKRLTPVLIKEVTRRCYQNGIYQAIYTAGIVLPKPVSTCRYYHRSLDWLKLYEVGFSPLPPGSTKDRQIKKNALPDKAATPGLRQMEPKDIDNVHELLDRYLSRFDLAQKFTREEVEHWLVNREKEEDRVVWTFVVEDPKTHEITDFFSFYALESSVIQKKKYDNVRAAYLYYYASEAAFPDGKKGTIKETNLRDRLQLLINDALIEAKKAKFDVFNALTLHDNPLFLEALKFGAGDGQLHYYLFNYRTAPIPGGVNEKNLPDPKKMGGIGMVLL